MMELEKPIMLRTTLRLKCETYGQGFEIGTRYRKHVRKKKSCMEMLQKFVLHNATVKRSNRSNTASL